jgi:hypothetical protein
LRILLTIWVDSLCSLANSIVFAGGNLGGAVTGYGPDALFQRYGPAWTYHILGIAALVTPNLELQESKRAAPEPR